MSVSIEMTVEARYSAYVRQCEEAVIGIAIIGSEYIDMMANRIQPDDFYDEDLGKLWAICVALRESGAKVDAATAMAEIKKQKLNTVFSSVDLARLAVGAPSVANADYYAMEVARLASVRKITWAATHASQFRYDLEASPEQLLAGFEARVQGAIRSDSKAGIQPISEAMKSVATKHHEALTSNSTVGIPTGFTDLDAITGGFHPGHLVLLGGRVFAGKTALALAMAIRFVTRGKSVFFVSLEMTAEDLAERALSCSCGIPLSYFAQGQIDEAHVGLIRSEADSYSEWKLFISDKPNETVRSIRAKSKLHKAAHGLDLLVIDNLQIIEAEDPREKRHLQLLHMTKALKKLAKELRCTILLLGQLNADAEDEEPNDTHWSESKQVVSDADIAILMHRPDKGSEEVTLKITKNRKGKPGRLKLKFEGAIQWFTDDVELP